MAVRMDRSEQEVAMAESDGRMMTGSCGRKPAILAVCSMCQRVAADGRA